MITMSISPFYYFITSKLQLPILHFIPHMYQINSSNQWIQHNFKTGELECVMKHFLSFQFIVDINYVMRHLAKADFAINFFKKKTITCE